ncbi:MAG: hypothetical protein ACE5GL_07305, partial [Calditrichia bacterium]
RLELATLVYENSVASQVPLSWLVPGLLFGEVESSLQLAPMNIKTKIDTDTMNQFFIITNLLYMTN